MITRRLVLLAAGAGTLVALVRGGDARPIYTGIVPGVAAGGYDVVAYHREGRPVRGSQRFVARHQDADWRFASAEARDAFLADPARFAPAYGGHCAWAAAQGYLAKGDPLHWQIFEGRLFLNYDAAIHRRWQADIAGFIRRADTNWPRLARA